MVSFIHERRYNRLIGIYLRRYLSLNFYIIGLIGGWSSLSPTESRQDRYFRKEGLEKGTRCRSRDHKDYGAY